MILNSCQTVGRMHFYWSVFKTIRGYSKNLYMKVEVHFLPICHWQTNMCKWNGFLYKILTSVIHLLWSWCSCWDYWQNEAASFWTDVHYDVIVALPVYVDVSPVTAAMMLVHLPMVPCLNLQPHHKHDLTKGWWCKLAQGSCLFNRHLFWNRIYWANQLGGLNHLSGCKSSIFKTTHNLIINWNCTATATSVSSIRVWHIFLTGL